MVAETKNPNQRPAGGNAGQGAAQTASDQWHVLMGRACISSPFVVGRQHASTQSPVGLVWQVAALRITATTNKRWTNYSRQLHSSQSLALFSSVGRPLTHAHTRPHSHSHSHSHHPRRTSAPTTHIPSSTLPGGGQALATRVAWMDLSAAAAPPHFSNHSTILRLDLLHSPCYLGHLGIWAIRSTPFVAPVASSAHPSIRSEPAIQLFVVGARLL